MNEPAVTDFEVSTNFLSDDELKTQLAAEADSHTAGAGEPDADAGDDADADATVSKSASDTAAPKSDKRTREGRSKSIQADIDRDVARREAAKREADAEETRLATLRAQTQRPAARTEPAAQAEDDPEPTAEQFADADNPWDAHNKAWTRWAARQEWNAKDAARNAAESATRQQQEAQTHLATFETTLKAEVGDIPTFLTSVGNITQQLVPFVGLPAGAQPTGYTAIADSLVVSSIPGKLLLHFHANRGEFDRIGRLPPNVALREVGILEGSLRGTAAHHGPASRLASAAPPPTKPLGGSPSVSADSDDDPDDLSEAALKRHFTRENTRDAKRRSAR